MTDLIWVVVGVLLVIGVIVGIGRFMEWFTND
jgi:hypothetical protein